MVFGSVLGQAEKEGEVKKKKKKKQKESISASHSPFGERRSFCERRKTWPNKDPQPLTRDLFTPSWAFGCKTGFESVARLFRRLRHESHCLASSTRTSRTLECRPTGFEHDDAMDELQRRITRRSETLSTVSGDSSVCRAILRREGLPASSLHCARTYLKARVAPAPAFTWKTIANLSVSSLRRWKFCLNTFARCILGLKKVLWQGIELPPWQVVILIFASSHFQKIVNVTFLNFL